MCVKKKNEQVVDVPQIIVQEVHIVKFNTSTTTFAPATIALVLISPRN